MTLKLRKDNRPMKYAVHFGHVEGRDPHPQRRSHGDRGLSRGAAEQRGQRVT